MGKKADGSRTGEQVDIRSLAEMPGLQLMRASFHTRTFPRHSHEGYGVGVIEQGALGFYYRGENVVAPAGRINTVNPDEVHTGQAATESGWTYRMFYFSADFLQHMTQAVCERPTSLPFFTQGVIEDPDLAGLIRQVHGQLDDIRVARLERETMLLEMFARLLVRHTYEPPTVVRAGREEAPIRRVIDYLDAHFGEDLAVDTLAAIACLSPYHFIRVFTRQTGLTPHAWLMQLRARKAKELLALGLPIADAAAADRLCRPEPSDQNLQADYGLYARSTPQFRTRRLIAFPCTIAPSPTSIPNKEATMASYVHGYSAEEAMRLRDQATTLARLLYEDLQYPKGTTVLEAGCGTGCQTVFLAAPIRTPILSPWISPPPRCRQRQRPSRPRV